ncbi:MAG TPA: phosphatidate cytidylyltransferase [Nevskiaceae bacterium]|nr:phosphatidate cytidylyltransferase [Nevskiaceae bacterium]
MLIQRVVTALVLLPLLLAAIWWLPTPWLYGLLSGAGLLVAWEWAGLIQAHTRLSRAGFVLLTAAALFGAGLLREHWPLAAALACAGWVLALVLVRGYPGNLGGRPLAAGLMVAIGLLLIVPTMLSLAALHEMDNGAWRLTYVFLLIFAADTGAYLAGRNLGRRKLAPAVSPGKTIEGALGGLLLCAAWALTGGVFVFEVAGTDLLWLLGLSLLAALASILGDLLESLFKRVAGVKDSGTLLPGHGGLLDRVDSVLAAAPVMALGVYLLQL